MNIFIKSNVMLSLRLLSDLSNCSIGHLPKMSNYYKDFIKPRQTNPNPRSFGFYTKNYSLLPLVGIVAASVVAVAFFSIHQFSNLDKRAKKKKKEVDFIDKRDELRNKSIENIEKTFAKNSDLKNLYLEMERAQFRTKTANRKSKIFGGA